MQVGFTTPPPASAGTAAAGAATSSATPDYNSFLRLLVAQLKNQDPTKPVDSTEYMSQLAAFSNVEQSVQINGKLDSLMTSFALSQAEALIGRTVTSADGSITGRVESVRIVSGGAVAQLEGGQEVPLTAGIRIS